MTFPVVLLILGVLYILTQPGAAANLGESFRLFGAIAAVVMVAAVIGGVAVVISELVKDDVGEPCPEAVCPCEPDQGDGDWALMEPGEVSGRGWSLRRLN